MCILMQQFFFDLEDNAAIMLVNFISRQMRFFQNSLFATARAISNFEKTCGSAFVSLFGNERVGGSAPTLARATADYEAASADEISLQAGDILVLTHAGTARVHRTLQCALSPP